MTDSKDNKIMDGFRQMAKDYDIKILLPKSLSASKLDNLENISISSHFRTNADNVISVTRVKSLHAPMTLNMQKVRNACPIMEILKIKDYNNLEKHMTQLDKEILSVVDVSKYLYNLSQSCIFILKNNMYEFLPLIEKSNIFDRVINDKESFWIKTIFSADNYNILLEKNLINHLYERSDFINLLINKSPLKIVNELLKKEDFRKKIEKEFNFINYIPIMMNSPQIEMLETVLDSINIKELKMNWDETFELFDKRNSMDSEKNNKYYFNEALKVFIIHSDYKFEKEDLLNKKISKENKEIVRKKILNQHLKESLEPKSKIKKLKI